MANQSDILILTAGFGEGHNSAARNLESAFEGKNNPLYLDPCAAGSPRLNDFLRKFYRYITTHHPRLWYSIYQSTENHDFSKERLPFMRPPERRLDLAIRHHQPRAIISTYPLYPYFVDRSFQKGAPRCPVFTVVTDSININAAWRNAPTDYFLVTDETTKESLIDQKIPAEKIIITGFPVNPKFAQLPVLQPDCSTEKFKILYFTTAKKPQVRRILKALLERHPHTQVTVVLGKNVRKLYSRAREAKEQFPGRVKIIGWTKRVPELMSEHHLVVGKAGGATVHEALAAACPMLIHHLVPGQEEGNLELLKLLGGGDLADTSDKLRELIHQLLENDAALWRKMKSELYARRHPQAATDIVELVNQSVVAEQ